MNMSHIFQLTNKHDKDEMWYMMDVFCELKKSGPMFNLSF